MIRLIYRTNVI